MNKKDRKDYPENQTSYRWFENRYNRDFDVKIRMKSVDTFTVSVLIEILKELQYMNKHL